MEMKALLKALDLGSSVAEFDDALDRYFIETEAFTALALDKADIIAGEKGTGKTALYRVFKQRYTSIEALDAVEVVSGFNPAGNPVFQRLVQMGTMQEGGYVTIWKAYLLSLVGTETAAAKDAPPARGNLSWILVIGAFLLVAALIAFALRQVVGRDVR